MTDKPTPEGEAIRKKILRFLIYYYKANGIPPTYREITENCSVSSTSVLAYHLDILESNRYITRRFAQARTILITDEGREYLCQQ